MTTPNANQRMRELLSQFLSEITALETALVNFEAKVQYEKCLPLCFEDDIRKHKSSLDEFKTYCAQNADCVVDINCTRDIFDAFYKKQLSFNSIKMTLQKYIYNLEKKVEWIGKLSKEIQYIGRGDAISIEPHIENAFLLIFTFSSVEKYNCVWARNYNLMKRLKKVYEYQPSKTVFLVIDLDTRNNFPFVNDLPQSKVAILRRYLTKSGREEWEHDIVVQPTYSNGMSYTKYFGSFVAFGNVKPKGICLAMPCPLKCGDGKVYEWLCSSCCTQVEYSEDDQVRFLLNMVIVYQSC